MNRSQILTLARMRLGFNQTLAEEHFLAALDFVQQMYETSEGRFPLPWFLLDTTQTVATVAGVRTISAPTDFLAFEETWTPTIEAGGVEYELKRKLQEELAPYVMAEGMPVYYAFDGTLFHLFPKPDAVYTVKVPCYRRSAVLSLVETSFWYTHFPTLILEEVVLFIAQSTRDEAALKLTQVQSARDAYRVRVEAMKHQHMEYAINGTGPLGGFNGT